MSLTMADSIYTVNLPAGFDAYLGYTDGYWPTIHGYTRSDGVYQPPLSQLFPGVPIIGLTVNGSTLEADGCDIETGDLGPVSGAQWLKNKLATGPALPPVAYCSVDNMAGVVSELAAIGVPRGSVLLLSAHYQWKSLDAADPVNAHICGPGSCAFIDLPQDGTQWTSSAPGNGGAAIDSSLLNDEFFGGLMAKVVAQDGFAVCEKCSVVWSQAAPAPGNVCPGNNGGPHVTPAGWQDLQILVAE